MWGVDVTLVFFVFFLKLARATAEGLKGCGLSTSDLTLYCPMSKIAKK